MSRATSRRDFMRKFTPKLRRRFGTLALGVSLLLPLLTANPRTVSVVAQQEPPPGAKAQVAYLPRNAADDGVRLPDLSSLDIPLLIRDSDRLGTAMHLRLPEEHTSELQSRENL